MQGLWAAGKRTGGLLSQAYPKEDFNANQTGEPSYSITLFLRKKHHHAETTQLSKGTLKRARGGNPSIELRQEDHCEFTDIPGYTVSEFEAILKVYNENISKQQPSHSL